MQPLRTIEWSPVIAGTILACAVSIVLMQFGHALGLSFTDLKSHETLTPGAFMALGLWTLWVQLTASVVGGYVAGRTVSMWDASHESELRDGAHGLLVWGLSTLLTALVVGAGAAIASLAVSHGLEPKSAMSTETLKRLTIIGGFSLAVISLVSATCAYYVATVAGDHRDRKVNAMKGLTFRRRLA